MQHGICRIWLLILATFVASHPNAAQASLPVEYALVGCIKGDKLFINGTVSPSLVGAAIKTLDGKTIRIEGYLSPGDRFQADRLFIVDDKCRKDLHKSYILCAPCRTLPNDPPSKLAPRREQGVAIQVPQEVIKQFNNLPRRMRDIRER